MSGTLEEVNEGNNALRYVPRFSQETAGSLIPAVSTRDMARDFVKRVRITIAPE